MMYIQKQRIIFNGDVDFKCPTACQTFINGPTSLRNVYYVIRFLKICALLSMHTTLNE